MDNRLSLNGYVSARLAETNTTKQRLADSMGIKTVATLNTKLNGESDLTLNEAIALADFLNISVDNICELLYPAA